MVKIVTLEPHDPLPDGPGRRVLVLVRFDEDNPRETVIELHLTGGEAEAEATRPVGPDGVPMPLGDVIEAARAVAKSEGLDKAYILDRTAGPRERDIIAHHGDHSVNMEGLRDDDLENGEPGTDMRDRRP